MTLKMRFMYDLLFLKLMTIVETFIKNNVKSHEKKNYIIYFIVILINWI